LDWSITFLNCFGSKVLNPARVEGYYKAVEKVKRERHDQHGTWMSLVEMLMDCDGSIVMGSFIPYRIGETVLTGTVWVAYRWRGSNGGGCKAADASD